MSRGVVVGSLHLDVVATAPRLPARDETVIGETVEFVCGGKGGNQAVAASRHGARTTMLGREVGESRQQTPRWARASAEGTRRLPRTEAGGDSRLAGTRRLGNPDRAANARLVRRGSPRVRDPRPPE